MITNQMYIDEDGRRMTRCWELVKVNGELKHIMYEVPTDRSQIRPERETCLWEVPVEEGITAIGVEFNRLRREGVINGS